MTSVRTVYIELRASADRLKRDMADANTSVLTIGKSGEESGQRMARGMDNASESVRRVEEKAVGATLAVSGALRVLAAEVARYSAGAAAAGGSTEELVNTYRGLRVVLSPTPFTLASIAVGILAEETIRLVNARARLIEQQSLIAATSGASFSSVQRIDAVAGISGGSASGLRGLSDVLSARMETNQGSVSSGLSALGLSPDDPDLLRRIAAGFDSMADPTLRAAAAVRIFGAANAGEALKELDAGFAESSGVVERYGLVLDSLKTKQIYQLHREIESLANPFRKLKEELRGLSESGKGNLESFAAAGDDASNRSNVWFGEFLRKMPALSALSGLAHDPESLSSSEMVKPGAGASAGGSADRVMDTTFLLRHAESAHFRKSQTLEGQQSAQQDAQDRADKAYSALEADAAKRQQNPKDPDLLTADQRFSLANEQQSAAALAGAIGERVAAMQKAADAQKLADQKAEQLAAFQAGARERLNALYRSVAERGITDPAARSMFEGRVSIGADADRTTPDEKAGRAVIATQDFRQKLAAEQATLAKDVLDGLAKANSLALKSFADQLGKDTEDKKKSAEDQTKYDAAAMSGVRDGGQHESRLASINSAPGDEVALAAQLRDIRLNTVDAERMILDAHRESYTIEQGDVEDARLAREEADAELAYQEQIAEILKQRQQAAIAAGGAYQQRLKQLSQELESLNSIKVTESNIRDIEAARKTLNDQILESAAQQKLAIGDLKSGWDAFWLSMEEQAAKPGKILYDGMHSALDGISGNLAKLATGQKSSFGKTFQSVGQEMTQSSIKSALQLGLGKLGGLFGIHGPAGKPDGTAAKPFHVVIDKAGASKVPGVGGAVSGAAIGGLKGIAGKVGGWFGKLLGAGGGSGAGAADSGIGTSSSDITFLAGGGNADPGKIYGVAEAGEGEFITPRNASTVTPLSKLGRGGGQHTYNIDARGADLGAENRVARAIDAAHKAAVSNSVRANAERSKRTPRRSSS